MASVLVQWLLEISVIFIFVVIKIITIKSQLSLLNSWHYYLSYVCLDFYIIIGMFIMCVYSSKTH